MIEQGGLGIAEYYFDDPAGKFFRSLHEKIEVHRGCSATRVMGLAWTTDEDVAMGFAYGHRGIPVHDPGLASAFVSRRDIFFAHPPTPAGFTTSA